jgi:hypothetical protein
LLSAYTKENSDRAKVIQKMKYELFIYALTNLDYYQALSANLNFSS